MTIYLDNAATSFPKPQPACHAVDRALRRSSANPGRGGHRMSLDAARLVLETREAVARLIGATDSSRIAFTSNATEALNLGLFGLVRPGDRVVTTSMEHNAVVRPLHVLAGRGVEVIKVKADATGFVDPAEVISAAGENTRLVVMSHCSNVTGTLQDIATIGAWCRKNGTLFMVDAAQSAGACPLDVTRMKIDLLAASGHKGLMGPPGTGFLFVAGSLELQPLLYGGTGMLSDSPEQPREMPERLESGTLNTIGLAGLHAAIGFIEQVGVEQIRLHEKRLVNLLLTGLAALPRISVYGPERADDRGAAVSFTVADEDPAGLGFRLDRDYDIYCRTGLHCAPEAHKSIGSYPAGTIRVSPGYFNIDRDIEMFLDALSVLTGSA